MSSSDTSNLCAQSPVPSRQLTATILLCHLCGKQVSCQFGRVQLPLLDFHVLINLNSIGAEPHASLSPRLELRH